METDVPKFGSLLDGNITLAEKTPAHQAVYMTAIILYVINLILSAIGLIFGITSWIVIPKWRRFQHYVFLNLIFACAINMIGFNLCAHVKFPTIAVVLLLLVPRIIMSHWLLVATAMFYFDIVRVYSNEIEKKYLKANVFAWIMPFVEVMPLYAIDHFCGTRLLVSLNYAICILLLVIACILYFTVAHSIIRLMLASRGTWTDIAKKVLIAYGLSIPSGFSSLFPILILEVVHSDMVRYNIGLISCLLSISLGNIGFLIMRRHRVLWAEYRRRQRTINNVYKYASSRTHTQHTDTTAV